MDQLPELLVELIRHEIYPRLPACDVMRLRTMSWAWNQAYMDATADGIEPAHHINAVQPSRGGSLPVRFVFQTDQFQQRATVQLAPRRNLPRLGASFNENRHPMILASCRGFLCIRLADPDELVIWSPVITESLEVPDLPADFHLDGLSIGLHIDLVDGNGFSPRCTLVAMYEGARMHHLRGGFVGFITWRSGAQNWIHQPDAASYLGDYEPRSVVTVENKIYFQVSNDTIFSSNIAENDVAFGWHDLPEQISGAFMSNWRGSLSVLHLVRDEAVVQVFRLTLFDAWQHIDTIELVPVIERFRSIFSSSAYNLRSRNGEAANVVLSQATIVGFDEGFLFMLQRGGLIRICIADNTARRIHHAGQVESVFGLNSSFLRLPI